MERRIFIKRCCYASIGGVIVTALLESCETIYYATLTLDAGRLIVAKSEFIGVKNSKQVNRKFVLLNLNELGFPICLYKEKDNYIAALMKCTHRGCELNVGGGIYSCPCHGSEFSITGKVLEGPADENLTTFKTETNEENIYIYLQ